MCCNSILLFFFAPPAAPSATSGAAEPEDSPLVDATLFSPTAGAAELELDLELAEASRDSTDAGVNAGVEWGRAGEGGRERGWGAERL